MPEVGWLIHEIRARKIDDREILPGIHRFYVRRRVRAAANTPPDPFFSFFFPFFFP